MYNAVPRAAQAWRALFERVFAETRRRHPHRSSTAGRTPIDALWREPELCCAFMCGWPFVRSGEHAGDRRTGAFAAALRGLAALLQRVPGARGSAAGARSRRRSAIASAGWRTNSQSGFNAPRAHLAKFVDAATPRVVCARFAGRWARRARALEALARRRGGRDRAGQLLPRPLPPSRAGEARPALRCVATTPWTPIPLLVAAPGVDAKTVVARLRRASVEHRRATVVRTVAGRRAARAVRRARRARRIASSNRWRASQPKRATSDSMNHPHSRVTRHEEHDDERPSSYDRSTRTARSGRRAAAGFRAGAGSPKPRIG